MVGGQRAPLYVAPSRLMLALRYVSRHNISFDAHPATSHARLSCPLLTLSNGAVRRLTVEPARRHQRKFVLRFHLPYMVGVGGPFCHGRTVADAAMRLCAEAQSP